MTLRRAAYLFAAGLIVLGLATGCYGLLLASMAPVLLFQRGGVRAHR